MSWPLFDGDGYRHWKRNNHVSDLKMQNTKAIMVTSQFINASWPKK
jgi:hypothetical protein